MAVQVVYTALSRRRQKARHGGTPPLELRGASVTTAGRSIIGSAPMSGMNMKERAKPSQENTGFFLSGFMLSRTLRKAWNSQRRGSSPEPGSEFPSQAEEEKREMGKKKRGNLNQSLQPRVQHPASYGGPVPECIKSHRRNGKRITCIPWSNNSNFRM